MKRLALLLPFLLLFPAPLRADVQDVQIAVNGVVCPVCAHSINMGLRHLRGIKSVKVLMEVRVNVDVKYHPGTWVEPERLFQQISQVGYRARKDEVKFRLRGTVDTKDSNLRLTLADVAPGPITFFLSPADVRGKQRDELTAALATVQKAAEADTKEIPSVEVEGWWRPAKTAGQPASLLVTKIQLLPTTAPASSDTKASSQPIDSK
jgi:hypothetical protein